MARRRIPRHSVPAVAQRVSAPTDHALQLPARKAAITREAFRLGMSIARDASLPGAWFREDYAFTAGHAPCASWEGMAHATSIVVYRIVKIDF